MKRRDFLKLIGIAPMAPSVLAMTSEFPELPKQSEEFVVYNRSHSIAFDTSSTNPTSCLIYLYDLDSDGKYIKIDEWESVESVVESPL